MSSDSWTVTYDGFEPGQQRLREALCTLGNGLFATRGAAEEAQADDCHYPGTYLAGGYDCLESEVGGRLVANEDLVNWPNWLIVRVRPVDGEWVDWHAVEILEYRVELRLREGVLFRRARYRDAQGRTTTLESRRLVHMRYPHLAAIETGVTAEDWSGTVEIASGLDGRVLNNGVERYAALRGDHLQCLQTDRVGEETIRLRVQTRQSHIQMAQAARTRVFDDGGRQAAERTTVTEPGTIEHRLVCNIQAKHPIRVEKVVAVFTSRDHAIAECGSAAADAVINASDFAELSKAHEQAWVRLWRRCDVTLRADVPTQRTLRLHVFHLLQTVSPHTIDVDAGVPARGLHGEAYRGHIFWDELFIFPFLNLRIPEITKSLLRYRYRRLPEARRAAARAGFTGAMYPWQSGSDGRETTQQLHLNPLSGRWNPDSSHLQRHINTAIVSNIWQYFQATGDHEFILFYGAEMVLEIARFLASLCSYNADLDRYEIRGVLGPDEYHEGYPGSSESGVHNNAYTNVMVSWTLWRALDLLEWLPSDRRTGLRELLELSDEELSRWDHISRKLRIVFHDDNVISQFEGYDALEEFDWDGYRRKYGNIQRLDRILEAEGDTPNRYKVSKQADVLMLFYLFSAEELEQLFERLGYPFDGELIRRNIDYYLPRTCDGSTLSRVVRAWVLARSDRPRSWQVFQNALQSDISDVQGGTTQEGIHLGAMAGTVDIVQRGYTGIAARDGVLWLNPQLPDPLESLRLRLRYRGQWFLLTIEDGRCHVEFHEGWDLVAKVGFKDRVYDFARGESRTFEL